MTGLASGSSCDRDLYFYETTQLLFFVGSPSPHPTTSKFLLQSGGGGGGGGGGGIGPGITNKFSITLSFYPRVPEYVCSD